MAKLSDIIIAPSTRALQPAATAVAVGALYFVTDEDVIERSNGATWDPFSGAGLPPGVILADGTEPFAADQSMGGNQLTSVGAPGAGGDAVNKTYADALVAAPAGALGIAGPNAVTSPVNLSTQGTIDWFAPTAIGSVALEALGTPQRKRFPLDAGFLGYGWLNGPGLTYFNATAATGITTTIPDSLQGALTNYTTAALAYNASGVDFGVWVKVKARKASRTLRVCFRVFSGALTIEAHLSDGSAADVVATMDSGAGAGLEKEFVITYNAAENDAVLIVVAALTINRGSIPHVGLIYGTIS